MKGRGENPMQMAGSDLCISRNETVRTRCFQNIFKTNLYPNVLSPNFHIHVHVSDLFFKYFLHIFIYSQEWSAYFAAAK